uniref:Putative secreted protein n=1 Tax=Anopheles triannulatus TaxID=58253 RepID=A0A2M4B6X0_9DIPT
MKENMVKACTSSMPFILALVLRGVLLKLAEALVSMLAEVPVSMLVEVPVSMLAEALGSMLAEALVSFDMFSCTAERSYTDRATR